MCGFSGVSENKGSDQSVSRLACLSPVRAGGTVAIAASLAGVQRFWAWIPTGGQQQLSWEGGFYFAVLAARLGAGQKVKWETRKQQRLAAEGCGEPGRAGGWETKAGTEEGTLRIMHLDGENDLKNYGGGEEERKT